MNERLQKARESAEIAILERIARIAASPTDNNNQPLKDACDAYYVFSTPGAVVEIPSRGSPLYGPTKI